MSAHAYVVILRRHSCVGNRAIGVPIRILPFTPTEGVYEVLPMLLFMNASATLGVCQHRGIYFFRVGHNSVILHRMRRAPRSQSGLVQGTMAEKEGHNKVPSLAALFSA